MTTINPGAPCGPLKLPASYNQNPAMHKVASAKAEPGKPKKRDRKPYTKKSAKK